MADGKVVAKTQEKVRKLLKQSFGTAFTEQDGVFFGRQGSTVVLIRVKPWTALDDAQVQIVAGVAQDVDPTPECLGYLLRENHDFVLGAFALEGERNIIFTHTVLGSNLDRKELEASVLAVASTGDKYDDIITSRFGGLKIGDMTV